METRTTVIYNGECPVCSREIRAYEKRARADGAALDFVDLTRQDISRYGLTPEDAARRLHVVTETGERLDGVPAFERLWASTPGFGWLGRLVRLPVIRQVSAAVYDHILAPLLFAMHRRRVRRR